MIAGREPHDQERALMETRQYRDPWFSREEMSMQKQRVVLGITVLVLLSLIASNVAYAGRKWNNPQNEVRYKESLRQQSDAYRNEAKAWQNYDRELGRAQEDVRRVRNDAMKGAVNGGGPGAAWGAASGAAKGIYERGRDYFRSRGR